MLYVLTAWKHQPDRSNKWETVILTGYSDWYFRQCAIIVDADFRSDIELAASGRLLIDESEEQVFILFLGEWKRIARMEDKNPLQNFSESAYYVSQSNHRDPSTRQTGIARTLFLSYRTDSVWCFGSCHAITGRDGYAARHLCCYFEISGNWIPTHCGENKSQG